MWVLPGADPKASIPVQVVCVFFNAITGNTGKGTGREKGMTVSKRCVFQISYPRKELNSVRLILLENPM